MSRPRLIFLRLWARSEAAEESQVASSSSPDRDPPLLHLRPWQPKLPAETPGELFFVGETRSSHGKFPSDLSEYLHRLVPGVEPVGSHGAYLDLSGCERLHPDRGEFLQSIARFSKEAGLGSISGGEASTRLVARLAAAVAPPGRWWAVEQPAAFLVPFPLRCLMDEYPGMVSALERMGLRSMGELAAMPHELLRQALGDEALLIWREARGEGRRILDLSEHRERIRERHEFPQPESDPGLVGSVLVVLADRLAVGLRALGLAAGRLELHVRFHGGSRVVRGRSFSSPSASLSELRTCAQELWGGAAQRRAAVESCELRAEGLREAPSESLSFDFAQANADLAPSIAEVRDRFGDAALRWSPELWMDQEKRSP